MLSAAQRSIAALKTSLGSTAGRLLSLKNLREGSRLFSFSLNGFAAAVLSSFLERSIGLRRFEGVFGKIEERRPVGFDPRGTSRLFLRIRAGISKAYQFRKSRRVLPLRAGTDGFDVSCGILRGLYRTRSGLVEVPS